MRAGLVAHHSQDPLESGDLVPPLLRTGLDLDEIILQAIATLHITILLIIPMDRMIQQGAVIGLEAHLIPTLAVAHNNDNTTLLMFGSLMQATIQSNELRLPRPHPAYNPAKAQSLCGPSQLQAIPPTSPLLIH